MSHDSQPSSATDDESPFSNSRPRRGASEHEEEDDSSILSSSDDDTNDDAQTGNGDEDAGEAALREEAGRPGRGGEGGAAAAAAGRNGFEDSPHSRGSRRAGGVGGGSAAAEAGPARQVPPVPDSGAHRPRRRRRRPRRPTETAIKPGLRKKLSLLTELLTNLDWLVFLELGTLYYLEVSFWRFCLRASLQYMFLTPKPESFPFLIPAMRSHVFSIFVPNTLCILVHLFGAPPQAPQNARRGYFHGGVLVDFVGQRPPTSRLPLLALDCTVLLLQCLMLAVHADREQLRGRLGRFTLWDPASARNEAMAAAAAGGPGGSSRQGLRLDLGWGLGSLGSLADAEDFAAGAGVTAEQQDAAERGEAAVESPGYGYGRYGIYGESEGGGGGPEQERRSGDDGRDWLEDGDGDGRGGAAAREADDALLRNTLAAGLGVLGEYNILHTLRTASMDFESALAFLLRTIGYRLNLTALAARRGTLPPESPQGDA